MREIDTTDQAALPLMTPGARTIVFLSVGVALVVTSVLLSSLHPTLEAISLKLGLVTIAIIVVDQLWRLCGGNPIDHQIASLGHQILRLSNSIEVIESSNKVGLVAVYDRQGNYGNQNDWINLVSSAVESVDLMGRTEFGWTNSKEIASIVLDKITRDNIKFRWLVMSKNNKYLPMIQETDVHSMLTEKLRIVFGLLRNMRQALPDHLKDNLQARIFSHVPLNCSLTRVDDRFYITQYLCSTSSENSPFLSLKGSEGAWPRALTQEFKSIWDASQNLFDLPTDMDSAKQRNVEPEKGSP
jgi:hypothetical protein